MPQTPYQQCHFSLNLIFSNELYFSILQDLKELEVSLSSKQRNWILLIFLTRFNTCTYKKNLDTTQQSKIQSPCIPK